MSKPRNDTKNIFKNMIPNWLRRENVLKNAPKHTANESVDLQELINATTLNNVIEFFKKLDKQLRDELEAEQKNKSFAKNTRQSKVSAEDITGKIKTKFESLISGMDAEKQRALIDKSKLAWCYHNVYSTKLVDTAGENSLEVSEMRNQMKLAETIKNISIAMLIPEDERNDEEDKLDDKYVSFSAYAQLTDKGDYLDLEITKCNDVNSLNSTYKNKPPKITADENHQGSADINKSFDSAIGTLMDAISRTESKLKRYIVGSTTTVGGPVKFKNGSTIDSLNGRIIQISNSGSSDIKKKEQLDQAVFTIYKQIRLNQGLFDSRLGNTLESYLKNQNYDVPHIIKKNARQTLNNDEKKNRSSSYRGK